MIQNKSDHLAAFPQERGPQTQQLRWLAAAPRLPVQEHQRDCSQTTRSSAERFPIVLEATLAI
jgi:hypothetical protein